MANEAFARLGVPIPPMHGPSPQVEQDGVRVNPDLMETEISPELRSKAAGFITSLGLNPENTATAKEFIKVLCRHTSYVRAKVNRFHGPAGLIPALQNRIADLATCVQSLREVSQQNLNLIRELTNQLNHLAQQRFDHVIPALEPIEKVMDSRFKGITVRFSANEAAAAKVSKMLMHSTKFDTFHGEDMGLFSRWVNKLLSGFRLSQPTEAQACLITMHHLTGRAAELAIDIPNLL